MTLEHAIDEAITSLSAEAAEYGYDTPEAQAAATLRAALPFLKAAEAFCEEWDKDARNVRDSDGSSKKLMDSRSALFAAYHAMKEAK